MQSSSLAIACGGTHRYLTLYWLISSNRALRWLLQLLSKILRKVELPKRYRQKYYGQASLYLSRVPQILRAIKWKKRRPVPRLDFQPIKAFTDWAAEVEGGLGRNSWVSTFKAHYWLQLAQYPYNTYTYACCTWNAFSLDTSCEMEPLLLSFSSHYQWLAGKCKSNTNNAIQSKGSHHSSKWERPKC